MIATVVPYARRYAVRIEQGCQSFRLDYHSTKEECEWMAKMFNIAISHAIDEAVDLYRPSVRREDGTREALIHSSGHIYSGCKYRLECKLWYGRPRLLPRQNPAGFVPTAIRPSSVPSKHTNLFAGH